MQTRRRSRRRVHLRVPDPGETPLAMDAAVAAAEGGASAAQQQKRSRGSPASDRGPQGDEEEEEEREDGSAAYPVGSAVVDCGDGRVGRVIAHETGPILVVRWWVAATPEILAAAAGAGGAIERDELYWTTRPSTMDRSRCRLLALDADRAVPWRPMGWRPRGGSRPASAARPYWWRYCWDQDTGQLMIPQSAQALRLATASRLAPAPATPPHQEGGAAPAPPQRPAHTRETTARLLEQILGQLYGIRPGSEQIRSPTPMRFLTTLWLRRVFGGRQAEFTVAEDVIARRCPLVRGSWPRAPCALCGKVEPLSWGLLPEAAPALAEGRPHRYSIDCGRLLLRMGALAALLESGAKEPHRHYYYPDRFRVHVEEVLDAWNGIAPSMLPPG